MRPIDIDKLIIDCMRNRGKVALSQSQLANAPTYDMNELLDKVAEKIRDEAIEFISDKLIYPLLDECNRGLWEHISHIELAEEWVKVLNDNPYPKVKNYTEARKRDLREWISEQLKEQMQSRIIPQCDTDFNPGMAAGDRNEEIKRISNQKCENCECFGRPEDAPETVKKDCMWEWYREKDESYIPPCKWKSNYEIMEEGNVVFDIQCRENNGLKRGSVPNNFAYGSFEYCPFCGRKIKWL